MLRGELAQQNREQISYKHVNFNSFLLTCVYPIVTKVRLLLSKQQGIRWVESDRLKLVKLIQIGSCLQALN